MQKNKFTPTVSIVTVTYNSAKSLEKTIISVINQQYSDYEFIIIDGKSNDQTSLVVERYSDNIDIFVSEKDDGVYDAMNKSLNHIRGKWVLFLNSGDTFEDNSTLSKVFSKTYDDKCCAIYGDAYCDNRGKLNYVKAKPFWNSIPFSYGSGICHQAIFIKSEFMKALRYDTTYMISSDFDLMVRLFRESRDFVYIKIPICIYETCYGLSARNRLKALEECRKITKRNKDFDYWKMYIILSIKYIARIILNI